MVTDNNSPIDGLIIAINIMFLITIYVITNI